MTMLKTKQDYRVGDIVSWNSVVYGSNNFRIVEVWMDGNPPRLLLTTLEYSGKCYTATCDDVTLVTRGAPEDAEFKRKDLGGSYARNPKRSAEPAKHPVATEQCP